MSNEQEWRNLASAVFSNREPGSVAPDDSTAVGPNHVAREGGNPGRPASKPSSLEFMEQVFGLWHQQ